MLGKDEIRRRIWGLLESRGVARFPRPVYGRIPNFIGAEKAAERISEQKEFKSARVIKVNPDSPQMPIRRLILESGKTLIMPTPKLRSGFLLLDPKQIKRRNLAEASSIRGAFKYGRTCPLKDLPRIDLVIVGSVAVSKDGIRIGKGGGYSEIEYGILRELNLIEEGTPVFTSIHDLQLIDEAPIEEHDLTVDLISTPRRIIRIRRVHPQPKGIFWRKLSEKRLHEMPILLELKRILQERG